MGCFQEQLCPTYSQATPTYMFLHVVYLYASSLNQPECIYNAVRSKFTPSLWEISLSTTCRDYVYECGLSLLDVIILEQTSSLPCLYTFSTSSSSIKKNDLEWPLAILSDFASTFSSLHLHRIVFLVCTSGTPLEPKSKARKQQSQH